MTNRFRYSLWDGSQVGFDMDSLSLMDQVSDDVMYHGDLQAALRHLMQEGLTDPDGNRIEGLRALLERLKAQRSEMLERNQLGGVMDDIAQRLRDIIDDERSYMDRQEEAAAGSEDPSWLESAVNAFSPKRMELDMLPPDLAGSMKSLSNYDFANPEAQERFDELVGELRDQLIGQTFENMMGAMSEMTPEDIARMKDMLAALNELLADKAMGREPDFDGFMERFGDLFPEQPSNLDELLEVMARRMAAMNALVNSMSPEQRAQLQALSDQLMEDMDLRWQMDRLSSMLRELYPDMGWTQRYEQQPGVDPLDLASASDLMAELGDLDQIEQLLRSATSPGALDEIDLERVRDLLGEDAAASIAKLADLQRQLERDGLAERRDGRFELTPQGLRRLGQSALAAVFRKLDYGKLGRHEQPREGIGHERSFSTRGYEFGDPFNLHIERTIRNATLRAASEGPPPGGSAGSSRVDLAPEDFEIELTEQSVRCATVLMLDLSLSMHMRDYFLAAKRTAVALQALIQSQFPRDYLGIVTFAESAEVISPRDLPDVTWDYAYGTNMAHGLFLARRLLARQPGTKQILMITDGEPTAHNDPLSGEPIFRYPPSRETVHLTLREVLRCTRANVRINTFMLEPDEGLQRFVEHMTEMNKGRAFYATPGNLGDYVLVDFLEQRRSLVRSRGAR